MVHLFSDKWIEGYAFSVHTIYSIYTGENEYGHPQFDTKRSPMGELVYQLKYKQNISVLPEIIKLLKSDNTFLEYINKDFVIMVPATNKNRKFQPVEVVADAIGKEFNIKIIKNMIEADNHVEIKQVEKAKKIDILKSSYSYSENLSVNKESKIIIFDDVYDSGSTMNVVADLLQQNGYKNLYAFALTHTRIND
ncbi:ComF family protein [Treponema bryantii]|uniref:ComF family protein n=1 Tax=Treponema bryantii TaxID=163 RepID=UPI0003B43DFF|nr:ComF family protein [Treponema bryantii]